MEQSKVALAATAAQVAQAAKAALAESAVQDKMAKPAVTAA